MDFPVCCSQYDKLSVYLTLVIKAIQDQELMNFQALACFSFASAYVGSYALCADNYGFRELGVNLKRFSSY